MEPLTWRRKRAMAFRHPRSWGLLSLSDALNGHEGVSLDPTWLGAHDRPPNTMISGIMWMRYVPNNCLRSWDRALRDRLMCSVNGVGSISSRLRTSYGTPSKGHGSPTPSR